MTTENGGAAGEARPRALLEARVEAPRDGGVHALMLNRVTHVSVSGALNPPRPALLHTHCNAYA